MKVMRFSTIVILAVAVAGLLGGSAIASNMGFKLVYDLQTGGSYGDNFVSIPYNFPDVTGDTNYTAQDIAIDIGTDYSNIARYDIGLDQWQNYPNPCLRGCINFPLTAGEGYNVRVNAPVSWTIVGSHDPSVSINLLTGGSYGDNFVSVPYHTMSTNAQGLAVEIGTDYSNIARYDIGLDQWQNYPNPCLRGCVNFALTPGEGLNVRVNASTVWNPSHY